MACSRARTFPGQTLHRSRIDVHPEPTDLEHRQDYFGNEVTSFAVFRSHDQFLITATSVVEVEPRTWESLPGISWNASRDQIATQSGPARKVPRRTVGEIRKERHARSKRAPPLVG